MTRMFLDDEREPVGDDWVIMRSVDEAMAYVRANGFPSFVSFDNDMGDGRAEGWTFAQWLIDRDMDFGGMPEDFDFYVHSQNCVRRSDIEARLTNYLAFRRSEAAAA